MRRPAAAGCPIYLNAWIWSTITATRKRRIAKELPSEHLKKRPYFYSLRVRRSRHRAGGRGSCATISFSAPAIFRTSRATNFARISKDSWRVRMSARTPSARFVSRIPSGCIRWLCSKLDVFHELMIRQSSEVKLEYNRHQCVSTRLVIPAHVVIQVFSSRSSPGYPPARVRRTMGRGEDFSPLRRSLDE